MAEFEIADRLTGLNEGGYANNKRDRGGETYAGIARNFWASWLGWKYIDQYKSQYISLSPALKKRFTLAQWINASARVKTEPVNDLVKQFYKVNFWYVNRLDEFRCQQLANNVYDFGVNSGKGRAAKFIQEVVGAGADGKIGQLTLNLINSKSCHVIYDAYNRKRENYYRSIAVGDQAEFLTSWLRRIKPYAI